MSFDINKIVVEKLDNKNLKQIKIISQLLPDMSPWYELEYTSEKLEKYFSHFNHGLTHYVIKDVNNICGVISIRQPVLRGIYLENLVVFPTYQNKGIGTKALEWIDEVVNSSECLNLWAFVSDFNHQAQQFYQSHGFNQIGIVDDFIQKGKAEILLRKQYGKAI